MESTTDLSAFRPVRKVYLADEAGLNFADGQAAVARLVTAVDYFWLYNSLGDRMYHPAREQTRRLR